jgi:hypothetical protein
MYCRICGTENDSKNKVEYHFPQRQALCQHCLKGVPAKVSLSQFVFAYFGKDYFHNDHISRSNSKHVIAKEFYEDYLASKYNLEQYIKATTSSVE